MTAKPEPLLSLPVSLGSPPKAALVALAKLHPAPLEPAHDLRRRFQNLCRSLQADPDFLWSRPVLANTAGEILASNMRFRAAELLGLDAIPAILDDINEQLAKERAPRQNRWRSLT